MADKKTDEEKKTSSFYSMGKGASYTDRTSGLNSLADAMNLQMQNYSEAMALAAAQRRAARQDKRAAKKDQKKGEEYNSNNTKRLSIDEIKEKLLELDLFKKFKI